MHKRVMEKVRSNDLDAFIIHNPTNINWMCHVNHYYLPSILLVTDNKMYIYTKSRNIDAFKDMYPEHEVHFGQIAELKAKCVELKINRIGLEGNYLSKNDCDSLEELFKSFEIIYMHDFVEDLRMIKTNDEIEKLQRAVSLSDACYVEFLNHLKPGLTEIQAKNILRRIFFDRGAEDLSFDILISSGDRSFLPHSAATDKVIQQGELVLMDFGIVLDGYCSDTTRTIAMGYATDKQQELYNLVLEAQNSALLNIREGITLSEADAFARSMIESKLEVGCFDYGLGHGIGRSVHEKPRMHPDRQEIMKKGMVVSVEPGIYIKGWGGIRIEDVLVVDQGRQGRNLTKSPKELVL
jgi:Xaa-Pro aminopeptidase